MARERGINRLDPNYLRQWRAYYQDALVKYRTGAISRADAQLALISLGYRDQALRAELVEFEAARNRR
jgi:hypothetical protein